MELTAEQEAALEDVFSYHAPSGEQITHYASIRFAAHAFARVVMMNAPESADRTTALRNIREAVMNANAAVALNGRSLR